MCHDDVHKEAGQWGKTQSLTLDIQEAEKESEQEPRESVHLVGQGTIARGR